MAVAALAVSACSSTSRITGADPGAAATVNGAVISMDDAERRIELSSAHPTVVAQLEADETGAMRRELEANAVTGLILSEILAQGAEELDISITDEDIAEVRAQVVEQMGGEEAYQDVLAEGGLSEDDVEVLLLDRARQERIQDVVGADAEVTDEDIQAFYDENAATRFGATASARHILVASQGEAEAVIGRLDDGEDFAELAMEVSTDPSAAENGGDLGQFGPGQMVPEFEEAVFAADAGDLVGPIETQFGFHVIEVLEVTDPPELAEVEGEIRDELQATSAGSAAGEWLTQRYADAEITVNPRFGEWDPAQTRIVPTEPLGETTPTGAPTAAPTE